MVHGATFAFILIQEVRTRCNVEEVGDWRASLPLHSRNTGQYGYLLLGMDFMRLKSLEMFENLSSPLHSRQHFPGGLKVSLQLRVGHVTRLQSTNLEFCEKRRKRLLSLNVDILSIVDFHILWFVRGKASTLPWAFVWWLCTTWRLEANSIARKLAGGL